MFVDYVIFVHVFGSREWAWCMVIMLLLYLVR